MLKITSVKKLLHNGKVARRIIILFLVTSLIPIIITSILSINYVSDFLVKNNIKKTQNEIKSYAFSLNDRLLLTEAKLKGIAQQIANNELTTDKLKKTRDKDFIILNVKTANGQNIFANTTYYRESNYTRPDTNNNKPQVVFTTRPDKTVNIYMNVEYIHSQNQIYLITAKLNSGFIWDNKSNFIQNKNTLIFDDKNNIVFHSKNIPLKKLKSLKDTINTNKSSHLTWMFNNENFQIISWQFYLKSRFNSPNLKIIIYQKEHDILSPIESFKKIFILVILLTLLSISLASLMVIRISLVPLERLLDGTRRLANSDFSAPVKVSNDDEFGELAKSFNTMSKLLGIQINSLTTLSEIDQLILSSTTIEKIAAKIINIISKTTNADISCITILNNGTIEDNQIYFDSSHITKIPHKKTAPLILNTLKNFLLDKKNNDYSDASNPYICFNSESTEYINTNCIFPVRIDDKIAALIYFGIKDTSPPDEIALNHITELANRLAVALATDEKDRQLYQQSHYDNLTQLPNRQLFNDRLDQEISHARRKNKILALLFIDLDRFKNVNDTLGHILGDKLLQLTAERLKNNIREADTVARLGGDEFVIILTDIIEPQDAGSFSKNLIKIISDPYNIDGNEIFIKASIGVSIYPFDGDNKTDILKHADTAMYRVKSHGRGNYMFFEEKMNHEDVERAKLEQDLNHAIENKELELYYQPIINLKTLNITGAEALLRWNHPARGIVLPSTFIPLAEETGLINSIGTWVIQSACAQYQQWKNQGIELEFIAVNTSAQQFLQEDFDKIISSALESSSMLASSLELEITESILLEKQIEDKGIYSKLKTMGINLSIDDFGTGYSSFSYLKKLPVSTLKIDLSFMSDVPEDENACSIVNSIIILAHTLNLKVITEGVESQEQLTFLQDRQSDYGQGNYFNPPMPSNDFIKYVLQKNNKP